MMSSADTEIVLVVLVLVLTGCVCLRVHVNIEDDETGPEEYEEEYRMFNSLDPEDPPFQIPEVTQRSTFRGKRADKNIGGFKRLPVSACLQWIGTMYMLSHRTSLHLPKIVNINGPLEMMCHYCGEAKNLKEKYGWHFMSRDPKNSKYFMYSVAKDIQRYPAYAKRVTIKSDHTLVINSVQKEDIGMYMCTSFVPQRNYYLLDKDWWDFFRNPKHLMIFYHLDLLMPEKVKAKKVSHKEKDYPPPQDELVKDTHANLMYFTNWGEWSTCTVCGEQGEKRSYGHCFARIINRRTPIVPAYLFFLLHSVGKGGIPCRSTAFKTYPPVQKLVRPDEIMYESCDIPCANNTRRQRMTIDLGKIAFTSLGNLKHKSINVTEGKGVDMKCPLASLDTMVYWVNGSRYLTSLRLRTITNRRAEIDVYGVLRFHSTLANDTGYYSCWHSGKRQIIYVLTVLPANHDDDWLYHLRFVGLSFVFDAFVFLALLAVKHKHRRVHNVTQKREEINDVIDDDDSDDETMDEMNDDYIWEDNNVYNDGEDDYAEENDVYYDEHVEHSPRCDNGYDYLLDKTEQYDIDKDRHTFPPTKYYNEGHFE